MERSFRQSEKGGRAVSYTHLKMIVYSSTREEAIRKMQSALCELVVGGARNNIEDQIEIIRDERFKKGDYYTNFIASLGKNGA